MTDAEYKVVMMAKAQQLCSAIVIVMATIKDAAPGELCHPRFRTSDPALDGPAGCAGLVLLQRQLRAPDAIADPGHAGRLKYAAVRDATRLDDRSLIRWAFESQLLPSQTEPRVFTGCRGPMRVYCHEAFTDGAMWRCWSCPGKCSIRSGSWTSHSHLTLKEIALLIAC